MHLITKMVIKYKYTTYLNVPNKKSNKKSSIYAPVYGTRVALNSNNKIKQILITMAFIFNGVAVTLLWIFFIIIIIWAT